MDDLIEKHITVNAEVQHGKPCFRGTRIPVYVVLELLEGGVPASEIIGQDYYPDLNMHHVRAALHFAAAYAKNQEYLFEKSA